MESALCKDTVFVSSSEVVARVGPGEGGTSVVDDGGVRTSGDAEVTVTGGIGEERRRIGIRSVSLAGECMTVSSPTRLTDMCIASRFGLIPVFVSGLGSPSILSNCVDVFCSPLSEEWSLLSSAMPRKES